MSGSNTNRCCLCSCFVFIIFFFWFFSVLSLFLFLFSLNILPWCQFNKYYIICCNKTYSLPHSPKCVCTQAPTHTHTHNEICINTRIAYKLLWCWRSFCSNLFSFNAFSPQKLKNKSDNSNNNNNKTIQKHIIMRINGWKNGKTIFP